MSKTNEIEMRHGQGRIYIPSTTRGICEKWQKPRHEKKTEKEKIYFVNVEKYLWKIVL